MGNPADLDAAFQIAKNVEKGLEALTNKVQPKEISNDIQKKQEPVVQTSVHRSKGHHCPNFKKCKFHIFLENGGKLWKMLHYAEQFFGIALLQHCPI